MEQIIVDYFDLRVFFVAGYILGHLRIIKREKCDDEEAYRDRKKHLSQASVKLA